MDSATDSNAALWPLVVFLISVHGLAIIMLGVSALLGERHRERATVEPSVIPRSGLAWLYRDVDFRGRSGGGTILSLAHRGSGVGHF